MWSTPWPACKTTPISSDDLHKWCVSILLASARLEVNFDCELSWVWSMQSSYLASLWFCEAPFVMVLYFGVLFLPHQNRAICLTICISFIPEQYLMYQHLHYIRLLNNYYIRVCILNQKGRGLGEEQYWTSGRLYSLKFSQRELKWQRNVVWNIKMTVPCQTNMPVPLTKPQEV